MQPVIYTLETEKTERGVTVYITPPSYVEIVAQREHMQASRWTLGPKQRDRIALAVQEERAAFVTCHNFAQAMNVCRWFQAEFG